MPRTPDAFPGVAHEEGTIYDDDSIQASEEGEVRYADGAFSFFDNVGEFDPREPPLEGIIAPVSEQSIIYCANGTDYISIEPLDFLTQADGELVWKG